MLKYIKYLTDAFGTLWDQFFGMLYHLKSHTKLHVWDPTITPHLGQVLQEKHSALVEKGHIFSLVVWRQIL